MKRVFILLFIILSILRMNAMALRTSDIITTSTVTATNVTSDSVNTNSIEFGDYSVMDSTTNFLGKTEKAADSDKLDGKDSSEFVLKGRPSRTYTVESLTVNEEMRVWQLETLE